MLKTFISIIFGLAGSYYFININTEPPKTKAELGKLLFFDPIMSMDSSVSCGSCHKPEFAFADSVAISPGIQGRMGSRNAPSVMNMAFRDLMFYDGRSSDLRDQVHFPIGDTLEMGFNLDRVVERLNRHSDYSDWFTNLYGQAPNGLNVADAVALFEESLETSDTQFDRWMNDQENTFSEAAKRGRDLFMSERTRCFDCHFGPDFTGDEFRNVGLYDGEKYRDKGRYNITHDEADIGKFKVPGLRNVAITGPYMHDGSFKTLEDVIDFYNNPKSFVSNPINIDTLLQNSLSLTFQEKSDLVSFLKSLTDVRFEENTK
ncbi:MAG: cytochrome c peroxidase [Saprospiraceae bacterium]